MGGKRTLALDFDGVIHRYNGWNNGELNEPLAGAVEFVREAVQVFQVYVVSSRCNNEEGIDTILSWLSKHGFPEEVVVTSERPPAYVSLDDRALTFTGQWPKVDDLWNFQPWWKD
jgi:hypothetical protein